MVSPLYCHGMGKRHVLQKGTAQPVVVMIGLSYGYERERERTEPLKNLNAIYFLGKVRNDKL